MIKPEDIFNATEGGLNIILDIYPQAKDCISSKKHFAIRNEKTPSASLREYNSASYGKIWQVTDFGGDGRGENAITVYMKEHQMDKSRFAEAMLQIASRYGIKDELNRAVNKPRLEQRPAKIDELDGTRSFELNNKFTDDELKALGPKISQFDVDKLHWHSVKWITNVKDRKFTVKYSTENYPIFIRECLISPAEGEKPEQKFYKIYEPYNCDKGFRFSYTPSGKKPQMYINGLSELKEIFRSYNAEEEKQWVKTHDDKPYKEKKLPEAFICSGERDSLCCHSMGYNPLWFNSETYHLSGEEYKEIMKYVEVLYNIPDIDETGRRKGKELSLRFIDIRTIWLPKWLETYHDNRGKSRKDLRDWMELRSEKKDFRNLMKLAFPAKFWESFSDKNGKFRYEINTAYLYNFLQLNGFYALHDEKSTVTQYVRIEGNTVKHIVYKDIREFLRKWTVNRFEDVNIINLILNTTKLSGAALESLQEIDVDFTSYTDSSQLFFFKNKTVEVKKPISANDDGLIEYEPGADDLHNFVWEENCVDHSYKHLDDMFKITRKKDEKGHDIFDIDIHNVKSHFFGYLINTSRTYWRKEFEGTEEFRSADEMEAYRQKHLFDIAGEGLNDYEIAEQKQNLINKIFVFGYMLHHYKSPSRAWAPMAMDNKIGEINECNGRSGKSFFFKVMNNLMSVVKLSGRNPKLMDNPHVFDQVTKHTDLLLVDDCDRYLNTGLFYDNITSDMTVNPKNNQSYTIKFEDSPKIAFTTNYTPNDFDPSSEARLLYIVFSDYYHQKTEDNDYNETRSIRDDFNKDLYGRDYTEEEWNADINFWLQCCKFYLTLCKEPIKIMPPLNNIIKRKIKADMGVNFADWAYGYFNENGENLDIMIQRDKAFEDYKSFSGTNKMTMQSFSKKLKAFSIDCPWIKSFNPDELKDANGRVQRKISLGLGITKTKDMIYLQTNDVPIPDDI